MNPCSSLHIAPTVRQEACRAAYLRGMRCKNGFRGVALVMSLCWVLVGWSQTDTEFWFVAPEVWAGHGDAPIVLRFATLNAPATITVEQPANAAFPTQTLNVAANATATLDLTPWMDLVENKPVNAVLDLGLHITATAEITAYYEVNNIDNPDIFTLKGSAALGTEFYTPFQTFLNNNYNESKAGLDLVATEDNTTITITPSTAMVGHPAGVPFDIVLDAGQTFSLRAASTAAAQHPAGTHIVSSAPIAITMSDDSIVGAPYGGTCFDLFGDQLIPVSVAGTEHIAVKGPDLDGPDKIFILATEDGTEVQINGVVFATLNAGQTFTHSLLADVAYYVTSAPAMVLHMTGVDCEVAGAVLPPLLCTGSDEVAFVRSTNEDFAITLIVPAGAEGGFAFNGNPIWIPAASFTPIAPTGGDWLFAQITTTGFVPTLASSRITNSLGRFHLGTINGMPGSYARYGFFSDFQTYQHTTSVNDDDVCPGETVVLTAEPIPGGTYDWTGPNDFTASGDQIQLGPLSVDDAGEYVVTGMAGDCPIEADTLVLVVNPGPAAPVLEATDPWCEGTLAELVASGPGESWTWTGPDGPLMNTSASVEVDQPGTYTVTTSIDGCSSEAATWEGAFSPAFAIELPDDEAPACEGTDWSVAPLGLPEGDWLWTTPLGVELSGEVLNWPAVAEEDAGWYVLSGEVNGCPAQSDSVLLTVQIPAPLTPNVPPTACTGEPAFPLEVDDPWGGAWAASCGACLTGSSFDPALAGAGTVTFTYTSAGACGVEAAASLEVLQTPDAGFGAPFSACLGTGEVVLVPAVAGGSWAADCGDCLNADGTFNTGVAGEGIWSIAYAIGGTCPSEGTGTFEVTPNLSSAFDAPGTSCLNDAPVVFVPEIAGGTWTADCAGCWSGSGALNAAAAGVGPIDVTYTLPGVCGSATTETLEVLPLPEAGFNWSSTSGCAPLWVDFEPLTASDVVACSWAFNGPENATSSWGCGSGAHVFNAPGCYDVSHAVIDGNGCTNTFQANDAVCVSAPPSAEFTWSPYSPDWSDPSVTLEALEPNVEWVWTVNGALLGTESSVSLVPAEVDESPWNLCLTTTDAAMCSATECIALNPGTGLTVHAPNAFTPDGDGKNEAWRLVLGGDVVELEVIVWDRWGMEVFRSVELEHWWDGRVQGGTHFASTDVYVWQAILRDSRGHARTASGHVALIR